VYGLFIIVGLSGNSSGIGETEDRRFMIERIGGGARLPFLLGGRGGGKSGIEGIDPTDSAADFLNMSSFAT
jgi:hypothetical protein